MSTLCNSYLDESEAQRRAQALRAAGVPGRDILLLEHARYHDVRVEPVGEWATTLGPDAPVGTFGDHVVLRRQGRGSFAGDPDRQRQGSFADTEREVIVSYADGRAHSRIAGHHGLRRLLRRFALDPEAAERALDDLDAGRAVVVADLADIRYEEALADQPAQAA